MSQVLGRLSGLSRFCQPVWQNCSVRHYWKRFRKGKAPHEAKSLAQRMKEWNAVDESLYYKVNIGFTLPEPSGSEFRQKRLVHKQQVKRNLDLHRAVKNRTFKADLKKIEALYYDTSGLTHTKEAADYFGIYEHLFENGYFFPVKHLDVQFRYILDEEYVSVAYRGNVLKPYEVSSAPSVAYDADEDELYTLALTTPDCHFTDSSQEYLHWLVGNIPGNKVSKGEELCDYLQPFPPRGVGYCRYVFVLYKQEKKLDFSKHARKTPCRNLDERTFYTYDFYRNLEDNITPVGLAFFQSDWDPTLTQFYHQVLDMKEPSFVYDFVEVEPKPKEWFPHLQPFNLYLDAEKDPKQLQKELLLEKLKERHPFNPSPKPDKYPQAYHIPREYPDWLKDDIRFRRSKMGKWRYLDD